MKGKRVTDKKNKEKHDLQSVKLRCSQEKQLGKDSQIIPIQAPAEIQQELGNKLDLARSKDCGWKRVHLCIISRFKVGFVFPELCIKFCYTVLIVIRFESMK